MHNMAFHTQLVCLIVVAILWPKFEIILKALYSHSILSISKGKLLSSFAVKGKILSLDFLLL